MAAAADGGGVVNSLLYYFTEYNLNYLKYHQKPPYSDTELWGLIHHLRKYYSNEKLRELLVNTPPNVLLTQTVVTKLAEEDQTKQFKQRMAQLAEKARQKKANAAAAAAAGGGGDDASAGGVGGAAAAADGADAGNGGGAAAAGGGAGEAAVNARDQGVNIVRWNISEADKNAFEKLTEEDQHASIGDNVFNHKGAMIFFIDSAGQILCGQESLNLFEDGDVVVRERPGLNLSDRANIIQLANFTKNNTMVSPNFIQRYNKLPSHPKIEDIRIPLEFKAKDGAYRINLRKRGTQYGVPKGGRSTEGTVETAYMTIVREVWEEVGIDISTAPPGKLKYAELVEDYALYYMFVTDSEKKDIEQSILNRNQQRFGELYDLQFRDFTQMFWKTRNRLTNLGHFRLQMIRTLRSKILGGRRRRITRKRTKRSKRSMKKTSRRTRRK